MHRQLREKLETIELETMELELEKHDLMESESTEYDSTEHEYDSTECDLMESESTDDEPMDLCQELLSVTEDTSSIGDILSNITRYLCFRDYISFSLVNKKIHNTFKTCATIQIHQNVCLIETMFPISKKIVDLSIPILIDFDFEKSLSTSFPCLTKLHVSVRLDGCDFSQLKSLRSLTLSHVDITELSIPRSLEELYLTYCHIKEMKTSSSHRLRKVHIFKCYIDLVIDVPTLESLSITNYSRIDLRATGALRRLMITPTKNLFISHSETYPHIEHLRIIRGEGLSLESLAMCFHSIGTLVVTLREVDWSRLMTCRLHKVRKVMINSFVPSQDVKDVMDTLQVESLSANSMSPGDHFLNFPSIITLKMPNRPSSEFTSIKYIASMFPNLTSLQYHSDAEYYMKTKLKETHLGILPLQTLKLSNMSDPKSDIITSFRETLTCLELRGCVTGLIEGDFPNLRKLVINDCSISLRGYDEGSSVYELHAPKLEYLDLHATHNVPYIATMDVPNVTYLDIEFTQVTLDQVLKFEKLKHLRALHSCIRGHHLPLLKEKFGHHFQAWLG